MYEFHCHARHQPFSDVQSAGRRIINTPKHESVESVVPVLDRRSLLVPTIVRLCYTVAISSIWLGVDDLFDLTKFPSYGYRYVPQHVWGVAFLVVGLSHFILLTLWVRGQASPRLSSILTATTCIAFPYTLAAIISTAQDHTGFLVTPLLLGGAFFSWTFARLPIWRAVGVNK